MWRGKIPPEPHRAHLVYAGEPSRAGTTGEAIASFEALERQGKPRSALGEQANVKVLGWLSEALASADEPHSSTARRDVGDARGEVAGSTDCRDSLDQHRFGEAEERQQRGLAAARRTGDTDFPGTTLQHLGIRHGRPTPRARSIQGGARALSGVENRAGDGTVNALDRRAELATRGRLAWYAEAERLARDLGDDGTRDGAECRRPVASGGAGVARRRPDERRRPEAAASVVTSLGSSQKRGDELGVAASPPPTRSPPSARQPPMRRATTRGRASRLSYESRTILPTSAGLRESEDILQSPGKRPG